MECFVNFARVKAAKFATVGYVLMLAIPQGVARSGDSFDENECEKSVSLSSVNSATTPLTQVSTFDSEPLLMLRHAEGVLLKHSSMSSILRFFFETAGLKSRAKIYQELRQIAADPIKLDRVSKLLGVWLAEWYFLAPELETSGMTWVFSSDESAAMAEFWRYDPRRLATLFYRQLSGNIDRLSYSIVSAPFPFRIKTAAIELNKAGTTLVVLSTLALAVALPTVWLQIEPDSHVMPIIATDFIASWFAGGLFAWTLSKFRVLRQNLSVEEAKGMLEDLISESKELQAIVSNSYQAAHLDY